jgi:uncharacterized protein YfaT (DUF1175 family)
MIDWQSVCRSTVWRVMSKRAALIGVIGIAAAVAATRFAIEPTAKLSRNDRPAEPQWALTDSFGDGTPDFLRLHSAADRDAFRRWFTFLAEMHFFRSPQRLPREVNDCGALLRFAYREALKRHDGAWASELGLDIVPGVPAVSSYNYPHTPLRAALFRVRAGRFTAADIGNGAFAEFADAETLMQRNTWLVSRDLTEARAGDLLFYRQLEQRMPFHAMIYLGPSQFEPGPEPYIVYHTGPSDGDPGEIRRPSAEELKRHPKPQWRPLAGNPYFLGVYRWNILVD